MVELHFLLGNFSWDFKFKVLNNAPFAVILGLDFFTHSGMVIDMANRKYHFGFAPDRVMKFQTMMNNEGGHVEGPGSYFEQLATEAGRVVKLSSAFSEPNPLEGVLSE